MPRKVTAYLGLLTMLIAGCASTPRCQGNQVAEWPVAEGTTGTGSLPVGTYALYHQDRPETASPPSKDTDGREKDPFGLRGLFCMSAPGAVGFEKGEDGQLFALVGEEKIPLPPGRYCWRTFSGSEIPEEPLSNGQKVVWVLQKVGETVRDVVLGVVVICVIGGILFAYVMAGGNRL